MRSARRPANGDRMAPTTAAGASPNPAASGDQPHTSWKNDGISTSQPNDEPTNSAWAMLPTVKLRSRNRSRSSSGAGWRDDRMKNHGSSTAATAEAHEDPRIAEPPVADLDDDEHDGADRERGERHGDRVEALALAFAVAWQHPPAGDQGGDDERQVDEEHGPPSGGLDEHGAERRRDRPTEPGDATPDADRHRAAGQRELRAAAGRATPGRSARCPSPGAPAR